jgi:hypothetical protein
MHRDPAQPCDEVLVRRNVIERPVQFKKHVLRYFFGGSAVAEHTVRDAEDPRLMRLDNLLKLAGDPWHCASHPAVVLSYTEKSAVRNAIRKFYF